MSVPAATRTQLLGRPLTAKQLDALDLVSRGLTVTEIGHRLCVSENTVKVLLSRVYAKLGATDRAHAVRRGFELGYLRPDPAERVAS